jgi:molybdopterin-guanine dinucleotide biosynthesis protein A
MKPSAAILNGGRARRFEGIDKGSLVVDGRTILDRQVEMLMAVPLVQHIFLVGGESRHPSVRVIADRIPGRGPLGGIHAALATIAEHDGDRALVLACDMPYVTADLATHLLELSVHADAVVPRTENGYHPLCGVYTLACLDLIARRLREGRLKVQDVLGDVNTVIVSMDELERFGQRHRLLRNVNTPGDYAALQTFHGHEL